MSSTLEAETLSLKDALEAAVVIQNKLAEMLNIKTENIRIEAFVDNNDAVQAIYSTKQMIKGRLAIDMGEIKDMIERGEVDSVRWIPKNVQFADSLTKHGASTRTLMYTLNKGYFPRYF